MPCYDVDLIVIGGGSAGVRLARTAASYGARVVLAEERWLGGTCVNVGCVPKKLLSYGAHFAEDFEDARGFGWSVGEVSFDWATLRDAKDKEIERLNGIYARLLERSGVEVHAARAVLEGPHAVGIGEKVLTAEYIAVCTGGWPTVPEIPGVHLAITSNEVFGLDALPERLLVVGGGYIAVEFASIFHGFGAHVDLAYRGDLFLRGFDDDLRHELANEMRKKGVHLHWRCEVTRIEERGDGRLDVVLDDGDVVVVDEVLMATGRVPNTEGLGLEAAGVEVDENGAIVVDDHFCTNVPSIYALGDVIDRVQLTPVALGEAMVVASNLFTDRFKIMDYRDIPTAVFTHPNVGTVGLSEHDARLAYPRVSIFKSRFRPMKHTLSGRDEQTFMKLVVDADTDRVLGCHMVGPEAGELIQGLAVALKCHATKAQFDATIGIHPTAAEEFVTMRTEWKPDAM